MVRQLTMKHFLALAPFSGASRVIRFAYALLPSPREGGEKVPEGG
jgi:hypothetical protein